MYIRRPLCVFCLLFVVLLAGISGVIRIRGEDEDDPLTGQRIRFKGTIKQIEGIDKIKQMPSYVYCEQRYEEGYHYDDGNKIVDKPVLCVYLAVDDMKQLMSEVKYMNSIFDVYDENGFSLLKEKFNPEQLL